MPRRLNIGLRISSKSQLEIFVHRSYAAEPFKRSMKLAEEWEQLVFWAIGKSSEKTTMFFLNNIIAGYRVLVAG